MELNQFLEFNSSPWANTGLLKESTQDGPEEWSDFLPGTSVLPQNNTKAPGIHLLAGDFSHGKLAPTNPLFIGENLGFGSTHAYYGEHGWMNDVNYRNRMRIIRHDLFNFTTDIRLTQQRETRSSVPLSNLILPYPEQVVRE